MHRKTGIDCLLPSAADGAMALSDAQSELRQLSAHQEALMEQERKRIAQELHDELGPVLTCIKAYIAIVVERQSAAGGAPEPLLAEALKLSDNAFHSVRRVIAELRPSVLDQLGVWAALEWYAGQVQSRAGLPCRCEIAPALQPQALDAARSTMVFRVVQEALTNVVRHAGASAALVRASRLPRAILVEVVDDGQGIDAARLLNHDRWGLLGMVERSRHLGCELRISAAPGQGTTVGLLLPLDDGA